MLEIKQLSSGYPGRQVLQDVTLTIPEGKITALLGPNGCGKSTLLKTLCGIVPVSRGQVLLDGRPLSDLPPKLLAQKVAYLAQSRQIPDITVRRLVLHGRFPYLGYPRRYRKEDCDAAERAMERLGILVLAGEPLQKLSGGQRQKAYIAMALAQNTPVILLDEPTTYLDVGHQLQLLAQVRSLREQGKTVVLVLHDLSMAMQAADHLIVMEEGRIAAEGTPQAVYASRCLDKVFGIKLGRVEADGSEHYYCGEDK